VVWIHFDATTLSLGPYHFFGAKPGERLPPIDQLPVAKHTKANAEGVKLQRPNLRVVSRSRFERVSSIPLLYGKLFGA
jgi:hypothetical protein